MVKSILKKEGSPKSWTLPKQSTTMQEIGKKEEPPKDLTMEKKILKKEDSLSSYGDDPETATKDSDPALLSDKSNLVDQSFNLIQETKRVFVSKILVYCFLACSAAVAGSMTYVVTTRENTEQYESDFEKAAVELASRCRLSLDNKFDLGETASTSITSFALTHNLTFPYVTIRDFERRALGLSRVADTPLVSFQPLVSTEEQEEWIEYAVENQQWVREGLDYLGFPDIAADPIPSLIWNLDGQPATRKEAIQSSNENVSEANFLDRFFAPVWQVGSTYYQVRSKVVNMNMLDDETYRRAALEVFLDKSPVLSVLTAGRINYMIAEVSGCEPDEEAFPHSFLLSPVYKDFSESPTIAGYLLFLIPWTSFFRNILLSGLGVVEVVLGNNCGDRYTLIVDGPDVFVKGKGDLHDSKYDYLGRHYNLTREEHIESSRTEVEGTHCYFTLDVYATADLSQQEESNEPKIYCIIVVCVFLFTAVKFMLYDASVQMRLKRATQSAQKTQAIVEHLFPKNIQARILEEAEQEVNREALLLGKKDRLKKFIHDPLVLGVTSRGKPLADLFPEASVIFVDIVGFTAWSSTREPVQVFMLLESIYQAFDDIAARRKVFKIETIGDCYVATVGLPDPCSEHAVVISRFAKDCLHRFDQMVRKLTVELGPDTEDLDLRIGIHSGPVVAGVLRGERARFQLFGETVDIASTMESTSHPGMIQLSNQTAQLLIAAGKQEWIRMRTDEVEINGKGEMQTYWLNRLASSSQTTEQVQGDNSEQPVEDATEATPPTPEPAPQVTYAPPILSKEKFDRLVAWNCDVLSKILRQVIAQRQTMGIQPYPKEQMQELEKEVSENHMVLKEVAGAVRLADYDPKVSDVNALDVTLSDAVMEQLQGYVYALALLYKENPFHNFQHASHVTMSVTKLLSRIVTPDLKKTTNEESLHDSSYGITSDPLTQFSIILSALIHDVAHPGVPNAQLVKEKSELASAYGTKSVAEQNSFELSWNLLMEDRFSELRSTIYTNEAELRRFRQIIVNTVMATDVIDKDLALIRRVRWDRAFAQAKGDSQVINHRKAILVIEHTIQASDVAHTMQHWHVYAKWNRLFFQECYQAYLDGRSEKNPADVWYKGELAFFDFYIIPLAKKLKDCGVFGVFSDEYLQYAVANRKEWECKGMDIVASMVAETQNMGNSASAASLCAL